MHLCNFHSDRDIDFSAARASLFPLPVNRCSVPRENFHPHSNFVFREALVAAVLLAKPGSKGEVVLAPKALCIGGFKSIVANLNIVCKGL